jgi:FtsP/CotA-like multicopper oxidase with cupredoxin domain
LTIKVEQEDDTRLILPDTLSTLNLHKEEAAVNVENPRVFNLSMGMGMRWLINGKQFEMTAVDKNERVKLGDVEVWEFFNEPHHMMGNLYHPMHIHGLQFQILERSYDTKYAKKDALLHEGQVDAGWHDTVLVLPGERVRLLMKFEDFEGLYLYHCHTLEHEDMGMMRNYRVSA